MKYIVFTLLLLSSYAYALRTADFPIITNGNMGGTSTIQGQAILLDQIFLLSMQATVGDSAAVGSLDVQASDDLGTNQFGAGIVNWTEVAGSSTAVVGTSSYLFNYPNIGHRWMRLIYNRTSGSGAINARASVKGN